MAVRIINTIGGSTRHGIIRQSSDFPTDVYSVCLTMYYDVDRTDSFQTVASLAFDNGTGFDATKRHWVMTDGSGGAGHDWLVSSDGTDAYATRRPMAKTAYRMGMVLADTGGGGREHRFYPDLMDLSTIAVFTATNLDPWNALTYCVFGSVPYTDFEGIDGRIANIKIFDVQLTTDQLIGETLRASLNDASLSGNLWAQLPCVNDANDISGNGRHFALTASATSADVRFDGVTVDWGQKLPSNNLRPRSFAPGIGR